MRTFLSIGIALVAMLSASVSAATITGTVTNQVTGDSLSGVTLILALNATPRTPVDTVTTSPIGGFTFADVDQGEYTLAVSRTGFVSSTRQVRVTGSNQTVTVDLELIPLGQGTTGAIRGTVRDSVSNLALGGVTMILGVRGTGGQGGGLTPVDTVMTSATGTYLFSGIPVSTRYVVTAIIAGYDPQTATQVSVTENDTTVVNFRMVALSGAKGSIIGTVRDSISSSPVVNAQVILRFGIAGSGPGGGSVIWTAVDTVITVANGAFSFGELAPNTSGNSYSITVSAATYRSWSSPNLTVSAGATDTVTVLLRRLSTAVSYHRSTMATARPAVQYRQGWLLFGADMDGITVRVHSLDGRTLYSAELPAGTERIALPGNVARTATAAVVSISGAGYRIDRTLMIGR